MNPWETVFQAAVEFHTHGQLGEAASLFAAILEYNAEHFPSLHRLAAIRRHQARLEESRNLLERAVRCQPDSADAHNSLGNTWNALGRQEKAIASYGRAIDLRPDFPEAHLNLANSFKALRRDQEAEASYRSAIALRPAYVEAHTNLGVVLDRLHRLDEALASFSKALELDPALRLGANNVAVALSALNRNQEALSFFQRARAAEPEAPEPIFNEALLRLAMGDFEAGWPRYAARLRMSGLRVTNEFSQPVWDGKVDLAGKTILLHAEQGMGDSILYARYVDAVVNLGARVVLEVQKPLVRLLTDGLVGVASDRIQALAAGEPIPEFDLHAPFGDLPRVFGTTVATIPARTAYLRPPAQLPPSSRNQPVIGICWAGNPNYSADYRRSVPLHIFQRLFVPEGARFVSLQRDLRLGDDSILAGISNLDLTSINNCQDLADTAALIADLDLVITVDTVIAHLAGALGRPVWVLLPFNAYWVWGRVRQDCDWYASARLFRQPKAGDWDQVCSDVLAFKAQAESQSAS